MQRSAFLLYWLPFSLAAESITIEIDYAGNLPSRTVETEYVPGTTALEVLKNVAKVTTKDAYGYTFVTAVDGLVSEPGKMGWFYSINGKKAKTMASATPLNGAAQMRWYYGGETCY